MSATLALVPIPEAPPKTPWEHVGQYLERLTGANAEAEQLDGASWNVVPTHDTVGRLHQLRVDLATDISYLEGVAEKLDEVLNQVVCEVRDVAAAS